MLVVVSLILSFISEPTMNGIGVVMALRVKNGVGTHYSSTIMPKSDNAKEQSIDSTLGSINRTKERNTISRFIRNDSLFKLNNLLNSSNGYENPSPSIALINPTFTAAAYYHSFYVFYVKYLNFIPGKNITSDLNLLTSKLNSNQTISSTSALLALSHMLHGILPHANIRILNDQAVDKGLIFKADGSNKYDVVVLGHQEYVTQREYTNLKHYVASGGTLIILDGNVFYAEVRYDSANGTITLVKGHSWAFNGQSAWRSVNERWRNETAEWVGSNYISFPRAIFQNDPFGYKPHEEQYITNPHDTILLNYDVNSSSAQGQNRVVATYELDYLKGRVIALGIYSDDIITNSTFDTYLDNLIFQYASSGMSS